MILSNGGEILQRREKSRRQRGSATRLTSGNRRQAGKEEAHKICGTDKRRTAGSPADRREDGKAEIDLVPKPGLRRFGRRKGESSREGSPFGYLCCAHGESGVLRGRRELGLVGGKGVGSMGDAGGFRGPSAAQLARARAASLRMTELGWVGEKLDEGEAFYS
jgi:hypothetical protein